MAGGLAPLGRHCAHLCVDCQRMFVERTDWHLPWMARVLPVVASIAGAHPAETIFTRFIPARRPGEGHGSWRRYYRRWASMTLENLDPEMVALAPELRRFSPPAEIIDKHVYSPWMEGALLTRLKEWQTDTLVITGGETDVCVLATVLGAVDLGFRVVLATDALCSSSDAAHDASLSVYHRRFGQQVETAAAKEILTAWQ